jgi:hypothetical protein
MSFITLDILADVLVDFFRELSETDCQNDLMSLVFQVLLDVMTLDQCEAVVDKTFDLLQLIVFDFPGLIFSGRPEYAGESLEGGLAASPLLGLLALLVELIGLETLLN